MFRLNIKNFKISTDDRIGLEGVLPCSLRTVLAASDKCEPWEVNTDTVTVEFSGVIEVEPHILSMKHICLRFTGVCEPAEVVLNGKPIAAPDSSERIYIYNVKDRLFSGYNTISIRFKRSERDRISSGIRIHDRDVYDPAIESVTLLAFNSAAINSVNVVETHSEEGVKLDINMGIIGDKTGTHAVATLVSPTGKIYYSGIIDGCGSITVGDPLLWWPSGIGVPNLYDLAVNLYSGDSAEDVCEMRVGLRRLTASCEGNSVAIEVDGTPLFLKGMRVLPQNIGAEFGDSRRLAQLVSSAARVGINAFYVSPYGKAPSNRFFELCDEYGILVIMGVSAGAATVASDDDSVKREIVDGPRRISYHASLAAFYINSEITPEADSLRELLETYCFGTTAVIAGGEPYQQMPISVPEFRSLSSIFAAGEDNPLSYGAEMATEPKGALPAAVLGMSAEYKLPNGNRSLTYLSQLSALDNFEQALIEARLASRRGIFADRLNDPSPLISSSSVDYFGRWKALHYGLARLYAPVTVLCRRSGYNVSFAAYNDRMKEYNGTITYRVLNTDNREIYHGTLECNGLAPMGSADLGTVNLTDYIVGYERDRYLAYSYNDGVRTREATLFFVPKKHFKFKPPSLRATVSGNGKKFDITLYSDGFVGRVWLGFRDIDAVFEENAFDISDKTPKRLLFETAEMVSAERLESELEIISLYDAGRRFREN